MVATSTMAHSDSQLVLDGHVLALLLLVTFLCQVPIDETEIGAQPMLLLYLVRAIEEVDVPPANLAEFRARIRAAFEEYPSTLETIGEYVDMAVRVHLTSSSHLTALTA